MVPYFGRHGCKLYMKGKPVKFGYKLWILSSFDGYPFYIIPYQGAQKENGSENSSERFDKDMKSKKENKTLSQTVVENLLPIVETPAKHKIYMDNFLRHMIFLFPSETSVSLLQEQLERIEW
ncbi:hypothetical protein AVEN_13306-1 [Araneus ventricosus]|uniref:PiggyBac transposable element-derived protein domain-containing protein n=1 Tax=Araneus ventricosus TaxID=182803 RepID=A0A4Y2T2S9_ARAVE|nr:hypothetical protein AVEN_13306-1 [Araneus ventricosus]